MQSLQWKGALAVCAAALLSGCISAQSYVDAALPPADKASVQAASNPQPIQVLYEFRTRGTPNAKATELTSKTVMQAVKDSGLFSEISPAPVPSGRRLVITLDNVPITSHDDAMAKGFGTGLTLGLVGSMVTDGYVCEATYSPGGSGDPVRFSYKHALHTTIGNASGPPGVVGRPPKEAIEALVAQLAWSVLRDLSRRVDLR